MAMGFISGYVLGTRSAGKAAGMAASAAQFGTSDSNRIYNLDDRLDRLTLVIQAMWSLMEEQGMTLAQLEARVAELDAADGTVDGKATAAAKTCPECGAKVSPGVAGCQFCGHKMGDPWPLAGL